MACAAAAVHKKKPQSRLLALLALSWACLQTAQPVRALAGPVRAALFDPRTPAFWLSRCSSRPSTSSSISTGPHRQLRPLRVSPRRAVQASEPSESEDDKDKIVASARDEQLQKTAQEKEDKGFDKSTEQDTLSQKLLEMAVKTWDGAQKDLDGAREDLDGAREDRDFARQRLREAVQNGDEKERKEAREEFEKAESKVGAAKEEATKAREELEKAKSTAPLQELTVKDFNISQCTRPEITVKPNQFVDLDQCVNRCVEAISKNLPKSTDGTTVRVPPVMLSRCMRGGKTTVLFYVFDRLQEQGKKPVFVSFNGDVAIDKVANEKPLVTLLRAIAVALMNQKSQRRENLSRLRCSEEALKAYLQDKTDVVLIIDELNVLLQPSATDDYAEVGAFLRREFLDRAGKHLIFSTHVPSSAGLDQLLGKGGGSSREAVAVAMPRSTQMPALRNMDNECSGLTICQAVFYGFIPSLIYSVQTQKMSFSIQGRFQAIRAPTLDAGVTKDFLTEFFTGRRCGDKRAIRAFDALTECPGKGEIRWILAYVGCMLSYLELGELSQWVEEIPVLAGQADSGMDWQAIVLIALALRCVQAKHVSAHQLLGLPAGAQPKEVYFYKIPPENCQQPNDVRSWWKKQKIEGYPYVAVLSPNYAKAAVFDVIWVYQRDPQSKQVFNGIQDKLGSTTPNQNVPHWFENGFLFRGRAPEKDTTPRNRIGWTYKGAEDILGFLGASLTAAYPANWP